MEQIQGPVESDEFRGALATARFAKNVFMWLIFLALVIQFSGFVAVRSGAIEPAEPAATQPATAPAAETQDNAWHAVYGWALPTTKFIALAAGMLLALTLLLSVKLSLLGRTGGVDGFLGAFFWSLVLWVFLIPWQQALAGSSFACGALYNLGELQDETRRVTAEDASFFQRVLYYLRFIAYPVLVFLLWLLVHAKFARGYRRVTLGVQKAEVSGLEVPGEKM
jgi:Na+-transporting methylmalonyl-CoA/oxaloacetate decarboxylase gamma subunit